jgi:diguanylate cyclase (GGDEF)-like protein
VIGVTVVMTVRNTSDLTDILEESIKSELISTSIAARGILNIEAFDSYNSADDIFNDWETYSETLENLRHLKRMVDATYIYALKNIDGVYYFVFDTDEEDDAIFDSYEISYVHERAFLGEDSAGIMNVVDIYGSFNTGAVPIRRDGRIIGIISTDIEDTFIQRSRSESTRNAVILIITLTATMGILTIIVALLLRNVHKMQEKLFQMANYDILTELPNRQYLMTYLADLSEKALKNNDPFAFLLIDLDNFKNVNDGAGHDAGDELLYLNSLHENSKSFRPPAGALNVSARIGGDEFVQIIPGVKTEDEARMVANKLLESFSAQAIDRYVEKYKVGLSIGVALFPLHTKNYNVLIKYADMAMYSAKKSGKNSYCVYEDTMSQSEPEESTDRRQFRR